MDTVNISKKKYEELLECKRIVDECENDFFYEEAKRISNLIKEGKMRVFSEEEVLGK